MTVALGLKAVEHRYRVLFTTPGAVIAMLTRGSDIARVWGRFNAYKWGDWVVLDSAVRFDPALQLRRPYRVKTRGKVERAT